MFVKSLGSFYNKTGLQPVMEHPLLGFKAFGERYQKKCVIIEKATQRYKKGKRKNISLGYQNGAELIFNRHCFRLYLIVEVSEVFK